MQFLQEQKTVSHKELGHAVFAGAKNCKQQGSSI